MNGNDCNEWMFLQAYYFVFKKGSESDGIQYRINELKSLIDDEERKRLSYKVSLEKINKLPFGNLFASL